MSDWHTGLRNSPQHRIDADGIWDGSHCNRAFRAGPKRFALARACDVLLALLLLSYRCSADQTTHFVDKETGVEIICAAEARMFPAEWYKPPISVTASALNSAEIARSVAFVKEALHRYPAAFVKMNLKKIYVVGSLRNYGVESGGLPTYERKALYLANAGFAAGYTESWFVRSINHEFAHLLAGNHPNEFAATNWEHLNPKYFHYGSGGADAIKNGNSNEVMTAAYLKQGFVSQYGTTAVEEDFATICEQLFTGDLVFRNMAAQNKGMRHKLQAVETFYHSLSPQFDNAYFQRLISADKQNALLACMGIFVGRQEGKQIIQVIKDSAADKAGLKDGDELIGAENVASQLTLAKTLLKSATFWVKRVKRKGLSIRLLFPVNADFTIEQQEETDAQASLKFPNGCIYITPSTIADRNVRKLVKVLPGSRIIFLSDGYCAILRPLLPEAR